jgi:hypothetical protein
MTIRFYSSLTTQVVFLQMAYAYSGSNFRWYMLQAMLEGNPPAICPIDMPLYLDPLWKVVSQCWERDPRSRPHARILSMHLQEIMRSLGSDETDTPDSDSVVERDWAIRIMKSGIWGGSEGRKVKPPTANTKY